MDMVADCSSASYRANAVLSDDRIILLDVNHPASMGPAVSVARAAAMVFATDYELQETFMNSQTMGHQSLLDLEQLCRRSSRSIECFKFQVFVAQTTTGRHSSLECSGPNGECETFPIFTCILCAFSWHI